MRKPFAGAQAQDTGGPIYANSGVEKPKDGIELGEITAGTDTHM